MTGKMKQIKKDVPMKNSICTLALFLILVCESVENSINNLMIVSLISLFAPMHFLIFNVVFIRTSLDVSVILVVNDS